MEIRLLAERVQTSAGQVDASPLTIVIGVPIHCASETNAWCTDCGNHSHWSQTRNGSAMRVAASSTNDNTVQLNTVPK